MSNTLRSLLALALVWATAWGIAGYFMGQAGVEQLAEADYVSAPATDLEPGADVRVEGTIVDGPSTVAPFSRKPCLAAVTDISVTSVYLDAQDRPQRDYEHVATRRVGPANLEIAVGDRRIEVPLDRWSPPHERSETVPELSEQLDVTPEEVAAARTRLWQGSDGGFWISETTIDGGTAVFVAGRLEDDEGSLRLAADPVLDRIVVHPGSQADFVAKMRGSGGGLRIAAFILGFGVGPLPLAIVGLVLLRRRMRARS